MCIRDSKMGVLHGACAEHQAVSVGTPLGIVFFLKRTFTSLLAIERLKTEVLQIQTVNFKKYADIIVNLQMKNDSYYLIKRFDDDMLDHIRSQFDKESGLDFMDRFNRLSDEIVQLQKETVPPESEKCQQIVKEYWGLIMEFTNGDLQMIPKLMRFGNIDIAANAWEERQKIVNDYLEPALQVYFSRLGTNPFEEVQP